MNDKGEKTYALVFDTDDEFMVGLYDFADGKSLTASHFAGLGAFKQIKLAYFDWGSKEYQDIPPYLQREYDEEPGLPLINL